MFTDFWRPDLRCGKDFPVGGKPSGCNPNGSNPCCSPGGWCGLSNEHCECKTCIDFRRGDQGITFYLQWISSRLEKMGASKAHRQMLYIRPCVWAFYPRPQFGLVWAKIRFCMGPNPDVIRVCFGFHRNIRITRKSFLMLKRKGFQIQSLSDR